MTWLAQGENPLLGARLLLVAASPADRAVGLELIQPWRRATVFMIRVYSWVPWVNGVTPSATASRLVWTLRSRPNSSRIRSRNSIISRNFQVVSMCMTLKGIGAGAKALRARCSRTEESLPIE